MDYEKKIDAERIFRATPICGFLRVPAKVCGFLRFPTLIFHSLVLIFLGIF